MARNCCSAARAFSLCGAYSLGASLGERLRQEVPDLQIQALLDGLKQAYQGKPLALDNARIEQLLAQHEAQSEADAQAPQSEKALAAEQQFLAKEKSVSGMSININRSFPGFVRPAFSSGAPG